MGFFDFPQLTAAESIMLKADAPATEASEGRANAHSFDKCLPPHDSLSGPLSLHLSQGGGKGIQTAASLKYLGVRSRNGTRGCNKNLIRSNFLYSKCIASFK